MSNKIRSLEKALKEKQQAKNGEAGQAQSFSVEGEAPPRLPRPGEIVEFCWADPNLVDSPKMTLGLLVSMVSPANGQTNDGRVNGWVVMDPTMQMPHPQLVGKMVQVPALIPVLNAAYSKTPKPMTWRYHGDKGFSLLGGEA